MTRGAEEAEEAAARAGRDDVGRGGLGEEAAADDAHDEQDVEADGPPHDLGEAAEAEEGHRVDEEVNEVPVEEAVAHEAPHLAARDGVAPAGAPAEQAGLGAGAEEAEPHVEPRGAGDADEEVHRDEGADEGVRRAVGALDVEVEAALGAVPAGFDGAVGRRGGRHAGCGGVAGARDGGPWRHGAAPSSPSTRPPAPAPRTR